MSSDGQPRGAGRDVRLVVRRGSLLVGLLVLLGCSRDLGHHVEFLRVFGGPGLDVGNAVLPLPDGGYAVAGYRSQEKEGQVDAWLLRLDAKGDTLWTRRYGGTGDDYAWDLFATEDGGLVVAGFRQAPDREDNDLWLLRVDQEGELVWERTYGGAADEAAWAVVPFEDGGGLILGQTKSFGAGAEDLYFVRFTATGDTVWTRSVGGEGTDRAFSLVATGNGAMAVGGSNSEHGRMQVLIAAVTTEGRATWRTVEVPERTELAHGITRLGSGRYLVTGYGGAGSEEANRIFYLLLNETGEVIERREIGGVRQQRAMMSALNRSGEVATVGYEERDGDWELILRFGTADRPGDDVWEQRSPGPDRGVMIQPAGDEGWVVTGSMGRDGDPGNLFVLKVRTPPTAQVP